MKMTIKGLERIDYYSKKNDRQVEGVSFHVEYRSPNVVGTTVETVYISDDALDNMGVKISPDGYKDAVGKTLEIEYNRRGYPQSILIN